MGNKGNTRKQRKEQILNALLFAAIAMIFVAVSTISTRADDSNSVSENKAEETKEEHHYGSSCSSTPVAPPIGTITINGNTIYSTVPGVYITNSVPGAAITTGLGGINYMVGARYNEVAYAEVVDSNCGQAAKTLIAMTAMQKYYLPGPMLDINIGKINAYGAREYQANFTPAFVPGFPKFIPQRASLEVGIPKGYLIPGYEPALLCMGSDATMEVIPADYFSSMSSMHVSLDKPRGVYMMIQAPMGSFETLKMERMNYYMGLSDIYPSGF